MDPSGAGFNASVGVEGANEYFFWDYGPLGERIPKTVEQVALSGNCTNCSFAFAEDYHITFPEGNYTVHYASGISDNHLSASFGGPTNVTVILPPGLDIRNPLLGGMNPPTVRVTGGSDGITATWNQTRAVEVRFYDAGQEFLLYAFGVIWLSAVVVALVPFLMVRRRRRDGL
ncbi:MAG: DUF5803 family protein [Methanomicrobiales archaeon]|nr:DUF5803 family protein [Methanomicrobiales archaeon]